jgi:hypothetical protein
VDAEEDIDECIRTISCKGDCSCDLEVAEKASAPEVGRGENNKDIRNRNIATTLTVHSDSLDNVSECVQTVHCAGDCADRQHTTTHRLGAETYDNSCRHEKTQIKHTIPSQEYVCTASYNDKTLSDKDTLETNILFRSTEKTQTSNFSKISDGGDRYGQITDSYKGNLLPKFDIWMKEMMVNSQNVGSGGDILLGGQGDGHARARVHGDV